MNSTKWTAVRIRALKGQSRFACLTAYDFATARLLDETGIPLILVGDSLAMTMLGYDTTLPVTMEAMLHHTAAVTRGVANALVVADMPFMSYQVSTEQAIENAGRFIKEAGAGAVKIEGGACRVALGTLCTGAFSNDESLTEKIITAGKETGELMWPMPMYDDYKEQLKSDVADIKNIGGRWGGAITAAKFLEEFIEKTPWVHLDIAGTYYTDKEKGYLVKGATGIPVRTLVNAVLALAKR